MRIFLGIKIPEPVQQGIYKSIQPLIDDYPNANWINPETYHTNVYFFGEREHTEKLDNIIEESIFDISPFTIYLNSGGLFQTETMVIQHATMSRIKELELVHERLAGHFGGKRMQQYIPHVTFGRYKRSSKQQYQHLKSKLEALDFEQSFQVSELHMFKSAHNKAVLTYEVMKTYPLLEM